MSFVASVSVALVVAISGFGPAACYRAAVAEPASTEPLPLEVMPAEAKPAEPKTTPPAETGPRRRTPKPNLETSPKPAAKPAATDAITEDEKAAVIRRTEQLIRGRAFASTADFSQWDDKLEKYQARLDRAETKSSFSRVLNSLVNEFGISHLDIMSPETNARRAETSMVGVGVRHNVTSNIVPDEGMVIDMIIPGGPAEKAGLKDGDAIIEVNGQKIRNPSELRGEDGSVLVLTVKRGETGASEQVTVTRGKFSRRDPEMFTKIGADAAVLRLPTFDDAYNRVRLEEFFKQAKDIPYLVIDLRNNGGGSTRNLRHFLGMLLPRGTEFGTSIDKRAADEYRQETGEDPSDIVKVAAWRRLKWSVQSNAVAPYKGKLAVLINGGSASASEIAAAALREVREPSAIVVGTPTRGAVLVANEVALPDGFKMMVPVSEYVTIKGHRLEGNPLQPDHRVMGQQSNRPAQDKAVIEALERLQNLE